jgi:hypothetical protein
MNKAITRVALPAAVIVLAVLLNPSAQRHRTHIKAAVADRSPIAGALGMGALTAFATSYHSLGVASYTKAGDKTVSWGAFGMVFVVL